RPVVVGQLVPLGDVTDGDLEVESRAAAIRLAGVVDEPPVVPAEDAAARLEIGVLVEQRGERRRQRVLEARIDDLIEVVADPGKGSTRNQPRRKEPVANPFAHEPQFRVGMDHWRPFYCRQTPWPGGAASVQPLPEKKTRASSSICAVP